MIITVKQRVNYVKQYYIKLVNIDNIDKQHRLTPLRTPPVASRSAGV